jgi:hypothetical protein
MSFNSKEAAVRAFGGGVRRRCREGEKNKG